MAILENPFPCRTFTDSPLFSYVVDEEAGADGLWRYDTVTFKRDDVIPARETALKVLKKLGHL